MLCFSLWVFSHFRHQALEALHSQNTETARSHARELTTRLNKFQLLPLALSENSDVAAALQHRSPKDIQALNEKLAFFADETSAAHIYVVDAQGNTLASSNYQSEDSFVGRSFAFRPYFQKALSDQKGSFFGKGTRTGKVGLFLSRRIDRNETPLGVVVVKVEFESMVSNWTETNSEALIVDYDGIILFSTAKDLEFKTLRPLSKERLLQIEDTRQFWGEPLAPAAIELSSDGQGRTSQGDLIVHDEVTVSQVDWRIVRITKTHQALTGADTRAWLWTILIAASLALIGYVFYRRSEHAHTQRLHTEKLEAEVERRTLQLSVANNQLTNEIDQRKAMNARFRAAREELAHANRLGSIGTITASVAHEMNQPIAAVQAFAENGLKFSQRGKTGNVDENFNSIIELSRRMGSITEQLRRYARRGTQQITDVRLDDALDGVNLLIGDRFIEKGVSIDINNPTPSPSVRAGFVRLEQVFVNLLQNALEALEGQDDPRVVIDVSTQKDAVSIIISDNGPGVPAELQSQVFIPFFTQKEGGLGIGLGITKDILNEMGGAIRMVDPVIGGASFEITLERA